MNWRLLCQWFIPTASILFRKYDDFRFPEWFLYCESGDIPLLLLLSLRGKLKYLDQVMSVYRLHDGGISSKHIGFKKVLSMIFIYQNFNVYTKFQYDGEITNAITYEINSHLPELDELRKMKLEFSFFEKYSILYKIKKNAKRMMRLLSLE